MLLVAWIWAVILISSLVSVVGFARAGSVVFWKCRSIEPDPEAPEPTTPTVLSYVAVAGLMALLVAHTVFAGPVHRYTTGIAADLFAPDAYISTVLETPGKLSKPKEGH